jgi:hypothetical protein
VFNSAIPAGYVVSNISKKELQRAIEAKDAAYCFSEWYHSVIPGYRHFKMKDRWLGSGFLAGTVASLAVCGYAQWRMADDDFRYLKNGGKYKSMRAVSGGLAIGFWLASIVDGCRRYDNPQRIGIYASVTPEYNGIGLSYKF